MAGPSPAPENVDVEALRLPQSHGEEEEKPSRDSEDSQSSVFSESRHIDGPSKRRTLSRTSSQRLERVISTASNTLSTIRSRRPIQPFSHPLSHVKTKQDVVVEFDSPEDPYRPINWTFKKKAITTIVYGLLTMTATFASSIFSSGTNEVAAEFDVGDEVAVLGTSLFLFGFGLGPLLFAPLSEVYGRKPAVIIPTFISGIFAFGCGASENIQGVLITRFFQGVFGSAPVTNTGGVLGDIWNAEQRGAAIVGYAMAVVGGQ